MVWWERGGTPYRFRLEFTCWMVLASCFALHFHSLQHLAHGQSTNNAIDAISLTYHHWSCLLSLLAWNLLPFCQMLSTQKTHALLMFSPPKIHCLFYVGHLEKKKHCLFYVVSPQKTPSFIWCHLKKPIVCFLLPSFSSSFKTSNNLLFNACPTRFPDCEHIKVTGTKDSLREWGNAVFLF